MYRLERLGQPPLPTTTGTCPGCFRKETLSSLTSNRSPATHKSSLKEPRPIQTCPPRSASLLQLNQNSGPPTSQRETVTAATLTGLVARAASTPWDRAHRVSSLPITTAATSQQHPASRLLPGQAEHRTGTPLPRLSSHTLPQVPKKLWSRAGTHRVIVGNIFDLFVVICSGQLRQALRVELATVREQLCPVLLGELRAKGVDGDDEGPPVGFKLQEKSGSPEDAASARQVLTLLWAEPGQRAAGEGCLGHTQLASAQPAYAGSQYVQ